MHHLESRMLWNPVLLLRQVSINVEQEDTMATHLKVFVGVVQQVIIHFLILIILLLTKYACLLNTEWAEVQDSRLIALLFTLGCLLASSFQTVRRICHNSIEDLSLHQARLTPIHHHDLWSV